MKLKVLEGSVLFISIVKWLLLATAVGILIGARKASPAKSLSCSTK